MYTNTGIDPDDMLPEAPELGAHSLCGGIMYEAIPDLKLNFAILNSFYEKETTSNGVDLEKNVLGLAVGAQYRF